MIQQADFPSQTLPLCVACQRLRPYRRGQWSCLAFPDGIPDAFLNARADHREPGPGDRGIRFEPDWAAPEVVLDQVRSFR